MSDFPKSIIEFDQFLNEPPQYEDQRMVRDYRYAAYAEWKKVLKDVDAMREAMKLAEEALRSFENIDGEECRYDGSAAFVMSIDSWNDLHDANAAALAAFDAPGKDM